MPSLSECVSHRPMKNASSSLRDASDNPPRVFTTKDGRQVAYELYGVRFVHDRVVSNCPIPTRRSLSEFCASITLSIDCKGLGEPENALCLPRAPWIEVLINLPNCPLHNPPPPRPQVCRKKQIRHSMMAHEAGLRMISVDRPGYSASQSIENGKTNINPGLLQVLPSRNGR